jgi:hypothetical protein
MPELERRLEAAVQGLSDLRCGSEEVASVIKDYQTAFHFSAERANLLRPLAHLFRGRILELGAGCGALTRYLGELPTEVVALESNARHAAIAAARCRDLRNVTVSCGDLRSLQYPHKFHCILMTGGNYDPRLLKKCAESLNRQGTIIVAIENRLGIKRFAGSLGEFPGGPRNRDGYPDPRGRKELEQDLAQAGFKWLDCLYPFPDWVMPRVLIHGAALRDNLDSLTQIIESAAPGLDQEHSYARLFSERKVWDAVLRNGLAESLANSFLVVASRERPQLRFLDDSILAYSYAVRRRRCYQKQNLLVRSASGLDVQRETLYDDIPPQGAPYRQLLQHESFLPGRIYANELYQILDTPNWAFDEVQNWAEVYLQFLMAHKCATADSEKVLLPPDFTDCTPFNLMTGGEKGLTTFDLEWVAAAPQPLDFVLFRGLLYALANSVTVSRCGSAPTLIVSEMVYHLFQRLGRRFTHEELDECWRREAELQKCVVGDYAQIDRTYWERAQLPVRLEDLRAEVAIRETELARISAEAGKLRHKVIEREEAADQQSREIERLRREIDVLHKTILERDGHLGVLAGAVASRDSDLRLLNKELLELRGSLAERDQRIAQAAMEADAYRARVRTLSAEAVALRQTTTGLQREVTDLRNSLSWRLTAPARTLISLLQDAREMAPLAVRVAYRLLLLRLYLTRSRRKVLREIVQSGIFDPAYYLQRYPDVARARIGALLHYLVKGGEELRNPCALFDTTFYHQQNPGLEGSGLDLLYHFLAKGGKEGRKPNPFFDSSFYCGRYPDVMNSDMNPLVHYIVYGAAEARDPSPLFDTEYYVRTNPDSAGMNPLAHYVLKGAAEGRPTLPFPNAGPPAAGAAQPSSPGEVEVLFDREYYIARYPDVLASGLEPLQHYLEHGVAEKLDPHPLFSTAFYLDHYPDVAKADINPLQHYLSCGGFEGRDPNPVFDSSFYLENNPDAAGKNPLVHYIQTGAAQGRDPNPLFNTTAYLKEHPEVAAQKMNPLAHYLASDVGGQQRSPQQAAAEYPAVDCAPVLDKLTFSVREIKPTETCARGRAERGEQPAVICVSHIPGYPPRAGNDYRIFRMLRWLDRCGYRIILIVAPLGGEAVSDAQLQKLGQYFSDVVLCNRDGGIVHVAAQAGTILQELEGVAVRPAARVLGEHRKTSARDQELLGIDRTFCHDSLIQLTLHLRAALPRCVVLTEYIFMTRLLPLIEGETLKIVDTIDVFSTKHRKVEQYGIHDLSLSPDEEGTRLRRADLILAIQSAEHNELSKIAPEKPVITVGVDFEVTAGALPATGRKILYVGSANAMNVKGANDFLRYAWPLILRDVPDAELVVAGRVGTEIRAADARVRVLGPVDDIRALYAECRVAINPAVAGTGLKIKTLEALSHFRPIVVWPCGTDGMDDSLVRLCLSATDWYEFYLRVVEVLLDQRSEWFDRAERELISNRLSAATVYAPLSAKLDEFFRQPSEHTRKRRSERL